MVPFSLINTGNVCMQATRFGGHLSLPVCRSKLHLCHGHRIHLLLSGNVSMSPMCNGPPVTNYIPYSILTLTCSSSLLYSLRTVSAKLRVQKYIYSLQLQSTQLYFNFQPSKLAKKNYCIRRKCKLDLWFYYLREGISQRRRTALFRREKWPALFR